MENVNSTSQNIDQNFNLQVLDIVRVHKHKLNFTQLLNNQQVEDGVSGKIENIFGELIFIGYVTPMILNKSLNMMVQIQLFITGNRKSLGVILMLVTDHTG